MSRREFKDYRNNNSIISILAVKETIENLQWRIAIEKRDIKELHQMRERFKFNKGIQDLYTERIQISEEFIKKIQQQIDNLIC